MATLDITQDANLTSMTSPAVDDRFLVTDAGTGELQDITAGVLLGFSAFTPGGRLTLTSGTPVTTADVTGATTVYYTPYLHDRILLWNGASWVLSQFIETSLALGTVTSGLPYDVFGYLSSGALVLEKLAWTNGTTRATAISLQDGRYCKTGDKTRLYLGTFYTTSTTTTEDSGGGTVSQTGGKRFLWNMYNRVWRNAIVIDTTDTWAYTTNTVRQANGATGNKVEFILGLSDMVQASVAAVVKLTSNSTAAAKAGVGVDVTNAFSGLVQGGFNVNAASVWAPVAGHYRGYMAIGYHFLAWCEKGADNTCMFIGDNAGDGQQTGLFALLMA